MEFGHIIEVHSIDSCDEGDGHKKDGENRQ